MVVEQQKLRGNYPWYCFYNPKLIEKDEMSEKKRKKEICKYGVRTYWMRRALSESIVNADSVKKMLISYHNICVYLSKCGEYEEACLLEKEVLEETLQKIRSEEPNKKVLDFLERIPNIAETDLQKMLWKNEDLDISKSKDFFSTSSHAIEVMQYLGDYYLQLGYYSLAQKWLSKVMLMRSVILGEMDGKTLDTVIRFYIVLFINQKQERNLLESLQKYVEEKIFRSEDYMRQWESDYASKGLQDKLTMLKEVITIGEEGTEQRNQQKAFVDMLAMLNL